MEDLKDKSVKVNLGTIPEILEHASLIQKESKSERWKGVSGEEKLKKMQNMFPEFGKAFPVVLRHITLTGYLYKDVLKKFILVCKNKPHHSIDEFRERQTDYMGMIYRKQHPRCSTKELNVYKEQCRKDLAGEQEHMKQVMDMVKEEREKMHSLNNEIKRSEILDLIRQYKDQIPDETETDLDFYNTDDDEDEEPANVFVGKIKEPGDNTQNDYNPDIVLEQLRHAQKQRLQKERMEMSEKQDDNSDDDVEDKIPTTE